MKIAFGSDHAGITGRQSAIAAAASGDHEIIDLGPADSSSVDYPDLAHAVANAVANGQADIGVLVCGTGQGMAMSANRHPGIRAAIVTDKFTAEMARAHNNANIACFGERVVGPEKIAELLGVFLATAFEGGRHSNRVSKIELQS